MLLECHRRCLGHEAWGAAEDIVLGHYREDSWRRNSGLIGLAGSGLGVLSEAQAVACAEHVPAASSGYIAGGIERLKRGLGFSKSAIDAGRAARAPPPAPVLRMRAAAYAGGQFIRSMAATAVGWCPREEALEVQEVEMKVFNFKNLEDLEHLEPTRQFDEEVEEVEGWLLLPEDSEALVRNLLMSSACQESGWATPELLGSSGVEVRLHGKRPAYFCCAVVLGCTGFGGVKAHPATGHWPLLAASRELPWNRTSVDMVEECARSLSNFKQSTYSLQMLQPRDFPLQAPMLVASAGNAGFAPAPAWRVEKPRVGHRPGPWTPLATSCAAAGVVRVVRVVRAVARRFPMEARSEAVSSAYIHIPFCRQKCRYCDFPIDVPGKSRFAVRVQRYMACLLQELRSGGAGAFQEDFQRKPLETLYFGGGTPSLLPIDDFRRIFRSVRELFGLAIDCEVTVEMDPGSFSKETAEALVGLGMVRASVGVQSLNDDTLRACGRSHSAAEAVEALKLLREAGVRNISADLLSGLPNQKPEELLSHIHQLVDLGVDHLSVYDLQYEPGTAFGKRFPVAGDNGRPSSDKAAEMYEAVHWGLEKLGFEHYEVSNYARRSSDGAKRSRHNQVYWHGKPYAAYGNGAASFVNSVRASRPRSLEAYTAWIEADGAAEHLELDTSQRDHLADAMIEATMLSLRTSDGLDLSAQDDETRRCLRAIAGALQRWEESGAVELQLDESGCRLKAKLIAPQGFLVSDALLSDAFAAVMDLEEAPGKTM
ncbi:unnamed protein product [Cladocopium goreaui]|uniref:Radical S-adenosyl methionine domain-containing protein 1, mitochondrial n=1 Tax=Cladocopium goreaui TaxID=2562237 RepID=A0A9P1D0U3_9DINO|nr:unnamed protein product [Cladocopium goreaui]